MSDYRVKTSHGQSLVSLTRFDPQPRCEGLQYTRETPTGSGIVREGPFFILQWNVQEEPVDYQAILTPCGLASAETALVTVYGPDARFNMVRYNATAVLPLVGRDVSRNQFFIRDIGILFMNLVAL